MVARLYAGDALAYRFNNTGALVPKDDRESSLGIVPRESVCIYDDPESARPKAQEQRGPRCVLTCMADSGVVDLNSDFVCLWRRDLDVLDAQLLAGFPCYSRLASNSLARPQVSVFKSLLPFSFRTARRVSGSVSPHHENRL